MHNVEGCIRKAAKGDRLRPGRRGLSDTIALNETAREGPISLGIQSLLRLLSGAIALCWVVWPGGARGISGTLETAPGGSRTGRRRSPPRSPARVPSVPGLDPDLLPRP